MGNHCLGDKMKTTVGEKEGLQENVHQFELDFIDRNLQATSTNTVLGKGMPVANPMH